MNNPKDYKCIALWGEGMGSMPYYITGQQELAAQENAPLDAAYKRHTGEWKCASDMPDGHTFRIECELKGVDIPPSKVKK